MLTTWFLCKISRSAGTSLVTIHGRTYRQAFKGNANWEPIYELKQTYPSSCGQWRRSELFRRHQENQKPRWLYDRAECNWKSWVFCNPSERAPPWPKSWDRHTTLRTSKRIQTEHRALKNENTLENIFRDFGTQGSASSWWPATRRRFSFRCVR